MRPLQKTNLADSAADRIRTALADGLWRIGEKLPNEQGLSDQLQVSRGTIREAVRVLVAQGLLETRQGSGTYVVTDRVVPQPLDLARRTSLRDRLEARLALEVEGARLAAQRARPAAIRQLHALLDQRGHSAAEPDRAAFIARDLAFHRAVIAAGENAAMLELYDFFTRSITDTIEATTGGLLPEPDLAAHRAIVEAIATGDPDAADRTVRAFMRPVLAALTESRPGSD
ncbi:FadR/GntR family transcriptional regulator [Allorhizobium taibaishanense]|uniref:DNA-binding FadR family transcriptional regulator n=1 Tax=Allorhizobium taibaishanense TaxID=887144 RepID=A0A1Q9A5J1_9HYPH|nr:FadR/GntR family transcriptional regulator [Allorhizobium taibaishanense]MBB4006869.1 DNA-binding FadR family transcriptional regulator [Allorhizobium taibaishanense]OLP49747.1 GntR family transcriptional regulator [Allorhizobium taibaishanense]